MKIAFVGDSFCGHHGPGTPIGEDFELGFELIKKYGLDTGHEENLPEDFDKHDWPDLVTRHFNAEPTYCGVSGANFYRSFEVYQRMKNDEDIIIFCLTEPLRMINKHKLPITDGWIDEITAQTNRGKWLLDYSTLAKPSSIRYNGLSKEKVLEIAVNAKYYKENIRYLQGSVAMHKAFASYVDQMMVEDGKKCIWFNSFPEHDHAWMKPFIPRSGPIGDQDLCSITKSRDHSDPLDSDPLARNHFIKDEQITMSKMIIDIIENDRFQPGKFSMEAWFELGEQSSDKDNFIYP